MFRYKYYFFLFFVLWWEVASVGRLAFSITDRRNSLRKLVRHHRSGVQKK